jgi:signal transduction histidine kinase
VSRGEAGNFERCQLRDIVEAAAEWVADLSQKVRVRIAVDGGTDVFVRRTRLERVFINLFSNAFDAMPDGGEIFVYSRHEDEKLKVFVEDTGPGVPPEVRAQLFRPFVTSGKRSGLGLGLTLSRQTMLDLGGDLELINRPGSGACFCLHFSASSSVSPIEEVSSTAPVQA